MPIEIDCPVCMLGDSYFGDESYTQREGESKSESESESESERERDKQTDRQTDRRTELT